MGTMDPKPLPSGRNKSDDVFAGILKDFMKSSIEGADSGIGNWVSDTFKMPAYEGDVAAPMNPLQVDAQMYGKQALDSFFAPGGGRSVIDHSLDSILNATDGSNPASLFAALDAPRSASLKRDLGQMEEEFGLAGMSGSGGLYESGARAASDSQGAMMAELAKILPQVQANQIQAGQVKAALPGEVAAGGFNLGEGARQIDQMGMDKQFQEFLRQMSLFPQLLSYLSGTPQIQYGPSPFSQISQAAVGGAAAASGFRG